MLGKNIREYRIKKGFTQLELGLMIEATSTTIHLIEVGENDNPKIKTLMKIAEALEVPIEELIK